jgi:hypothetical protein
MPKSTDNERALKTVVNLVAPQLSLLKYKKSKHRFNRTQPDGIVHVVDFQMGQNWSILWGKFTVEIGVFIPAVYYALLEKRPPTFIPSYDCFLRKRLGSLSMDGKDIWWDLHADLVEIANEITGLLAGTGEMYFSQLDTREKIAAEWERKKALGDISQREILMLAILYSDMGERDKVNTLISSEFGDQYKSPFLEYARNVVTSLGLPFPELK